MSENTKKGGISVDSEHLFPIIKKWLYSDKDIFLREIVSNASDAVTKLKRLESLGEISLGEQDYRIDVVLDKDAGTLTVSDNGIGMTGEELEKYICNIALSGAVEFIQKYEKDESGKPQEGIIGHFGLGFYSSFMVSDTVTVITKSYTSAPAVKWVCNSEGEYETFESDREERGTSVIMKISDDEKELLQEQKIKDILDKYCSFMPVPIFYSNAGDEDDDGKKKEEKINDTTPLWMKQPSECTDEEYKEFYKKVFRDFRDPLFWVHINAEYPLNFKGIIFFPKLNSDFEPIEGQVKLYYNQVFVADNIKEVIPDFLLMLRGVLDCPELPLNVSRSYLQNNGYVSKIASHIVKKVADKLNGMMNTDRENYEKIYDDIKVFVEYGCMRDKKFYDRVKGSILFPSASDGKMMTTDEYLEAAKEKHENKIYYATDKKVQAQYIDMYEKEGVCVFLLDRTIDTQFISTIESDRNGVKFCRVDSDVADVLKNGEAEENEKITELFRKATGKEGLSVSYAALKDEKTPAVMNEDEDGRRFSDFMRLYRMGESEMPPADAKLIVNTSSQLYKKTEKYVSDGEEEKAEALCKRIYGLATLAHRQLTADELKDLLDDAYDLLLQL